MVDTNLPQFENDLNESALAFTGGGLLKIKHRFSEGEGKIVNTVTVNGNSYAYGTLFRNVEDEIVRKRLIKRYAKLSIYKTLSKVLEEKLPWGALTGIRPTKLAYQELKENGEYQDFFINKMQVTESKFNLVKDILKSQEGIYDTDTDKTDFYVSIPFCPSRCEYCSFINADIKSAKQHLEDYVNTLCKEIENSKKFIKKLKSIYVGGGTPVVLENRLLEKILNAIDKINNGVEYTVEAGRPDAINSDNVKLLLDHGVNRICVNPQTFNDKTLALIGRKHTSEQVVNAFNLVKDKFITNMDLIAGLPEENFEDFKHSMDKAINLKPDNITVHTLCVKKGSHLAEKNKFITVKDIEKMVDYARESTFSNGYNPYYIYRQKYMAGNLENVGYSLKGKECIYNINVMEEISNNVSCGAGAISKAVFNDCERLERYASPKDVLTYINKIDTILEEKEKLYNDIK